MSLDKNINFWNSYLLSQCSEQIRQFSEHSFLNSDDKIIESSDSFVLKCFQVAHSYFVFYVKHPKVLSKKKWRKQNFLSSCTWLIETQNGSVIVLVHSKVSNKKFYIDQRFANKFPEFMYICKVVEIKKYKILPYLIQMWKLFSNKILCKTIKLSV